MTDRPRISCIENSLLDTLVNIIRIISENNWNPENTIQWYNSNLDYSLLCDKL